MVTCRSTAAGRVTTSRHFELKNAPISNPIRYTASQVVVRCVPGFCGCAPSRSSYAVHKVANGCPTSLYEKIQSRFRNSLTRKRRLRFGVIPKQCGSHSRSAQELYNLAAVPASRSQWYRWQAKVASERLKEVDARPARAIAYWAPIPHKLWHYNAISQDRLS